MPNHRYPCPLLVGSGSPGCSASPCSRLAAAARRVPAWRRSARRRPRRPPRQQQATPRPLGVRRSSTGRSPLRAVCVPTVCRTSPTPTARELSPVEPAGARCVEADIADGAAGLQASALERRQRDPAAAPAEARVRREGGAVSARARIPDLPRPGRSRLTGASSRDRHELAAVSDDRDGLREAGAESARCAMSAPDDSRCVACRSGPVWPAKARAATAMIVTAGLALVAAACGGSPGSHAAQLDSTTTQPAAASSSPNAGGSPSSRSLTSQPLAFSHCMRSHGVPNFPDPDSSGVWPKSQVEFAAGNPRFQAATQACGAPAPRWRSRRPTFTGRRATDPDRHDEVRPLYAFPRCAELA